MEQSENRKSHRWKPNFHFKSVRLKFFAAICAFAVAFIAITSLLNLFLYDDYYLYTQKNTLRNFMSDLSDQYTGELSPILGEISQLELEMGLRISILTTDGDLVYDTILYSADAVNSNNSFGLFGSSPTNGDLSYYLSNLRISLVALQMVDFDELAQGAQEFVAVNDPSQNSDYLCLVSQLHDDYAIARIPYAYMEQNSSFNAIFLLISGGMTLLMCLIWGYFLSKRFTEPLIAMNQLATDMAGMDFTQKYHGKAQDEVGQLGQSLNVLSYRLEQAIAELQASNAQLHDQVRAREQIDALRREFIINVSHELKTPIALVQGYAEGLQAGIADQPEDRNYYCQTIVDEAQRMNTMVSQLLGLSKLEDGHILPQLAPVEVGQLCREAVEKTAVLWQEKQLQLDCTQTAVWAHSDASLLMQVVDNYLTNAIRYTPAGGWVHVNVHTQTDGSVCISVANQGEAVPASEIPRLWDKFYRTDKARSRELGGTGIGLSIVRATAETLGATYGAENVEGGMWFWFCVPKRAAGGAIEN